MKISMNFDLHGTPLAWLWTFRPCSRQLAASWFQSNSLQEASQIESLEVISQSSGPKPNRSRHGMARHMSHEIIKNHPP